MLNRIKTLGPKFYITLLISGLGLFNFSYYVLKNLQIYSSREQRNPHVSQDFIRQNIPAGSFVVGEPMYYYAVTQAGSQFQFMDWYADLEVREQRQRELFDYDYLIITDHMLSRNKRVIHYYLQHAKLEEIARLELPQSAFNKKISTFSLLGIPILSNTERYGYSCTLYKRIK
ncbi:hypothetical protein AAG747_01270 [Rapidithrix thailandica]|uniref:Uncharacterized protein n=1 Tax=Rapidithrix thailandica TaxID=413964 RepID=A0AAW9RYN5_9BACT